MSFVKALFPGTLLTFIVCLFLGSSRYSGGWLNVFYATVQGVSFYWSWPLFLIATGLSWAIFWMME